MLRASCAANWANRLSVPKVWEWISQDANYNILHILVGIIICRQQNSFKFETNAKKINVFFPCGLRLLDPSVTLCDAVNWYSDESALLALLMRMGFVCMYAYRSVPAGRRLTAVAMGTVNTRALGDAPWSVITPGSWLLTPSVVLNPAEEDHSLLWSC